MKTLLQRLFAVLFICVLTHTIAFAEKKEAIASGDWSNPNIWDSPGVPLGTDSVVIDHNNGNPITVTISNSSATCAAMLMDKESLGDSLILTNGRVLTVTQGIINNGSIILIGGGGTINIGGDWTNNGEFVTANGTMRFFGANDQSISGGNTVIDNFIINKSSGTVTLLASMNVNSNWIDSAGTIDIGAFSIDRTTSGSGLFLLAGTSTLKIGGTNAFPINYFTYTLATTSNVIFNGGSQTISNRNYGNLQFSGSGTKTATESIIITGDLTIDNGVIFAGSSSKTHQISGNWINNGSYTTATSNIVEFTGVNAQTISGATATQFRTLRVNKSSGALFLLTNITLSSKLILTSGTFDISTFTANRATASDSFAVYGTSVFKLAGGTNFPQNFSPVYFATTSICELPGTTDRNIPGATFGNLLLSGTGNYSPSGNFTTNGTFTINATASFTENSDTGKTTINGALVANGNYTSIATTTFSGTTTLSGSADIKFGSVNITGTLNDAGKTFPVRGNWTKSGTFTTTGTTLFDSTLAQSVGASNFKNLTINKPSGTVTLTGTATVSNNFTLTSGTFSTGANKSLTVMNDVNIEGGQFNANGSNITFNGDWNKSGGFSAGTSSVSNTPDDSSTIDGSTFYNLTLGAIPMKGNELNNTLTQTASIKSSGNMTVQGTLTLLTNVKLGSDTLVVTNSAANALTGDASIIDGSIQRAILAGSTSEYRFESNNTKIAFDGNGTNPTSITLTTSPNTLADTLESIYNFSSQLDSSANTVIDTVSSTFASDSGYARFVIGKPLYNIFAGFLAKRIYAMNVEGGTGYQAYVSFRYEESETPTYTGEDGFRLMRLDGPNKDTLQFRTFKAVTSELTAKAIKLKFKNGVLTSGLPNIKTVLENVFDTLGKSGATFLGIKQIEKDSIKKYAWVAYKKATDLGKFFTIEHTGKAYPLDSLRTEGKKSKKLSKAVKPDYKKTNNKGWAQGILLKLNLLASKYGKTTKGFGSLLLDTNITLAGMEMKGKTLDTLGIYLDSANTYYAKFGVVDSASVVAFTNFVGVIEQLNTRFYDSLKSGNYIIDTTRVVTDKKSYAVRLKGIKHAWESNGLVKSSTAQKLNALEILDEQNSPNEFMLFQNYPNPFNPRTAIRFTIHEPQTATLKVYDVLGREVTTLLHNEKLSEGTHEIPFNASAFASGVYFYRLHILNEVGNAQSLVRKMMLVK